MENQDDYAAYLCDPSGKCGTDPDFKISMGERDPWERPYAAIVPRISGGISAVSSVLLIYVILLSKPKLCTIYHRIMFGLSIADIFSSLAMTLTSLPMPSHMPLEEAFGYFWAGTRIGNTHTCNAQGFFAFSGTIVVFLYTGSLCLYYFFAIALSMKEEKIKKYIEVPVLHGIPILIGLGAGITPLFFEMYNPSITTVSWCFVQPYPNECYDWKIDVDCIRGKNMSQFNSFFMTLLFFAGCNALTIVLSLSAVVVKVKRSDALLRKAFSRMYKKHPAARKSDLESKRRWNNNSKAVLVQSTSYIVALFAISLPPLIRGTNPMEAHFESKTIARLDKITLVLLPLQGFFNFVIFISHKMHARMNADEELTIKEAFISLFCVQSYPEPCYISRIMLIRIDDDAGVGPCPHEEDNSYVIEDMVADETSWSILQLHVENENHGEEHVRIIFRDDDEYAQHISEPRIHELNMSMSTGSDSKLSPVAKSPDIKRHPEFSRLSTSSAGDNQIHDSESCLSRGTSNDVTMASRVTFGGSPEENTRPKRKNKYYDVYVP